MGLLDNFQKEYDRRHYKRHPKSKIAIQVIYAVLLVILTLSFIRAYKWVVFGERWLF